MPSPCPSPKGEGKFGIFNNLLTYKNSTNHKKIAFCNYAITKSYYIVSHITC